MNFAPLGVFGAIAAVISTKGLDVFVTKTSPPVTGY
jgi:Na+/H+-dicarboxylate symporter